MTAPKSLIINSPFVRPARHWADKDGRLQLVDGRRPAGYDIIDTRENKGVYQLFNNRQTALRASQRLRRYMDEHEVQFEDLGRDTALLGDPIVLRAIKLRGKAKSLPVPTGEPVVTYRAEMDRINRWLAEADIACDYDNNGNPRDAGERWLRRIFNDGRLDQGGRLYGGFWQAMSGEDRLHDITLNNEPVANLDYGQCGIRIAYGLVGAQPPPGDLYCVPGLERFRKGVKKVLNAQLARTGAMTRMPVNTRRHFSDHLSIREVEKLILRHHHPIREQFYGGHGLTHQFIDSQVLVQCLLRLIDLGLQALPVHDGLLVPQSQVDQVVRVMEECFKEITGVDAVVSIQGNESASASSPSSLKPPSIPPDGGMKEEVSIRYQSASPKEGRVSTSATGEAVS